MSSFKYRVTFYDVTNDGPEAGMSENEEVYSCYADMYEPTQKDVQLANLELSKNSTTVIIRNAQPEFIPLVNQTFEVLNGIYKGLFFNVKNVAPAKVPNYVKVVGEEQ